MLKGLSHAAILVTDLDRALEFYKKIPGITEQFRLTREDGSPWLVYLKVGPRQFVELFPSAKGQFEQLTHAGYSHICFEVDDIQEMHRAIVEAGIKPHREPILGADGSWQFWINDPDGNPMEFHQFTPDSMQLREGE